MQVITCLHTIIASVYDSAGTSPARLNRALTLCRILVRRPL